MTLLILPGGTDVAEVALFDTEAIPTDCPSSSEAVAALVSSEQLIRLPTGGDGGYLLHAYVDDEIPADLMQYCLQDDPLRGRFRSVSGTVAFGGLESAFKGFKPNEFIRADGQIRPGSYDYVAYHTEYPEHLMTDEANKAKVNLTPTERLLLSIPTAATLLALAASVSAAVSQHFALVICIGAASYFAIRVLVRSKRLKELRTRQGEWERRFPSIVIQLLPRVSDV